jgi:hypothetical protein
MKQKVGTSQPQVLKTYNLHIGRGWTPQLASRKVCDRCQRQKSDNGPYLHAWHTTLLNAWLLYRHTHGMDTLDFLSFKCAEPISYLKFNTSRKQLGKPLSSTSSYVRVIPDVRFHGVCHVIAQWKVQRICAWTGCKGKPRSYCFKCNTTLYIQCFAPHHNNWEHNDNSTKTVLQTINRYRFQ